MRDRDIRGLLRERWGFSGVLISDYGAIAELIAHGVAGDLAEAAALALSAGVDIDMMGGAYAEGLPVALERGLVPESALDEAAGRVLTLKERLGLFDDPYARGGASAVELDRALAREAAARSIVLLGNDGVLPLRPDARTLQLIEEGARWLAPVSARRLWTEFELTAGEPRVAAVVALLDDWGVLLGVHPDLHLSPAARQALQRRRGPLRSEVLLAVLACGGHATRLVVEGSDRHVRVTVTVDGAVHDVGQGGPLERAGAVVDTVGGRMSGDLGSPKGLALVLPRR